MVHRESILWKGNSGVGNRAANIGSIGNDIIYSSLNYVTQSRDYIILEV